MTGETPATVRIVVEIPPGTAEALGRMAATLGTTPEEAAERILTAAATVSAEAAIKAVNTTTWRRPRRRDR